MLMREAFGREVSDREAELIGKVMDRMEQPPEKRRRYGARCLYVMEDGKKCKQRGWLRGEFCFHHDPGTAELRKLAGRPRRKLITVTKGQQVEALLDETMEELRAGRMKPGQAYAVGYVAQLMLMARESRRREAKFDVKWFWDMVDLMVAFENAEKKAKEKAEVAKEERKRKKAKKAREADSFASQGEAQDEEAEAFAPQDSAPFGSAQRKQDEEVEEVEQEV